MKLNYYNDFLLESKISELILESKLVLSDKLIKLFSKMDNKFAKNIVKLSNTDIDGIVQNYIDITDSKENLSFTPDRKVIEITGKEPIVYKVIESARYLTHAERNDGIFSRLGYDKTQHGNWAISQGERVIILSETISKSASRNTYCMVKGEDNDRIGVINKVALEPDNENIKIWSTSRNNIKVGRFVRALLSASNISFTDSDIENFVNQFKATYDFAMDVLKQFKVVKGDDISYWYSESRYQRGNGTMNNSCMADVSSDYFDIYTCNDQVSLLILFDDEGSIENGEYTSDKIKGRAILWECEINGVSSILVDRIYTVNDSDVELFKQYATKNGWFYKIYQDYDENTSVTNVETTINNPRIFCKLQDARFDYYPFMDTLPYVNRVNNTCGNSVLMVDPDGDYAADYDEYTDSVGIARSTEGYLNYVNY